MTLFRQRLQQSEPISTEWVEQSLRTALLEDGRRILEELLAQMPEPAIEPVEGQRIYSDRHRPNWVWQSRRLVAF